MADIPFMLCWWFIEINKIAEEAVSLIKNVVPVCAAGGFNLTKFISNHPVVLAAIPEEDRKVGVKEHDIDRKSPWLTVLSDSKKTKLEASPSAAKNTEVVLVSCSRMEVCPYSDFFWCGYLWGPCVPFVMTDEFSVGVTKITSRIGITWTHSLTFYF